MNFRHFYDKLTKYFTKKSKIKLFIGNYYLGTVGLKCNIKDSFRKTLKIGDTVLVFNNGKSCGESPVVKYKGIEFIMTLNPINNSNMEKLGYKILKKRSFNEINNGEIINGVTYIKK